MNAPNDHVALNGQWTTAETPKSHIMTPCEVCGRRVFVLWFAPGGDGRTKCGRCSRPQRADVQRTFPDHDAGDEDRTE